jgi:NAD(P)-dependent dehydrogenase (short-subunit alcohol dehydrogenase family)
MVNLIDISGKRILVTGASSGIGRAVSVMLSKLGADVVLVARNYDRLNETYKMLDTGKHEIIPFDISEINNIVQLFNKACNNDMKLDGLVHSAGIGPIVPLQNIDYEKMQKIMTVNYFSFIEMVKFFSKRKYSNGGSIVAVSSVSSFAGWKGASLYCGSKGALDSSIKALAIELSDKNIRINSVVPSNIKTDMLENVVKLTGDDLIDKINVKQPLGLGNPEDVANAVAFLLSDASKFITGTAMIVDGGYLAQ